MTELCNHIDYVIIISRRCCRFFFIFCNEGHPCSFHFDVFSQCMWQCKLQSRFFLSFTMHMGFGSMDFGFEEHIITTKQNKDTFFLVDPLNPCKQHDCHHTDDALSVIFEWNYEHKQANWARNEILVKKVSSDSSHNKPNKKKKKDLCNLALHTMWWIWVMIFCVEPKSKIRHNLFTNICWLIDWMHDAIR